MNVPEDESKLKSIHKINLGRKAAIDQLKLVKMGIIDSIHEPKKQKLHIIQQNRKMDMFSS